jgi:hypothetical protein
MQRKEGNTPQLQPQLHNGEPKLQQQSEAGSLGKTDWQPLEQDKLTVLVSFKSTVGTWCKSDSSYKIGHH